VQSEEKKRDERLVDNRTTWNNERAKEKDIIGFLLSTSASKMSRGENDTGGVGFRIMLIVLVLRYFVKVANEPL
jgi:hypothetical protein